MNKNVLAVSMYNAVTVCCISVAAVKLRKPIIMLLAPLMICGVRSTRKENNTEEGEKADGVQR